MVHALKQQREEAQDKLLNAYTTIMRLQRELDRMKAEQAKEQAPSEPIPLKKEQAPASPK
jgi:hypothetical protein